MAKPKTFCPKHGRQEGTYCLDCGAPLQEVSLASSFFWGVFGLCFAIFAASVYVTLRVGEAASRGSETYITTSAIGMGLCTLYWVVRYLIPARFKRAAAIFVAVLALILVVYLVVGLGWYFLTDVVGLSAISAVGVFVALTIAAICAVIFSRKPGE